MKNTVLSNMDAHVRKMKIQVVLISALLVNGCAPLPTVPHGLGVIIDSDTFETLTPGTTDRADVLMLLGEPQHHTEEDRFLIYEWTIAYGYILVGGPYQAYPIPVAKPHYLCLEFSPDSRLIRRRHLTGSFFNESNEVIHECTEEPEGNE